MKEIVVVSANIGGFENPVEPVQQSIDCDFFMFDDTNFPLRDKAMTPRLQARIPKMFGWQMAPGYQYYIWVDSSMAIEHTDMAKWFLEQLGDADIAVFKHPHRNTTGEEAQYVQHRLDIGCPYITPRYENELLDEQIEAIGEDLPLYASTAFIYRNTYDVQQMMKEWFYHTARYHVIDQLGLPYALEKSNCRVNVIPNNYLKIPYITHARKR